MSSADKISPFLHVSTILLPVFYVSVSVSPSLFLSLAEQDPVLCLLTIFNVKLVLGLQLWLYIRLRSIRGTTILTGYHRRRPRRANGDELALGVPRRVVVRLREQKLGGGGQEQCREDQVQQRPDSKAHLVDDDDGRRPFITVMRGERKRGREEENKKKRKRERKIRQVGVIMQEEKEKRKKYR